MKPHTRIIVIALSLIAVAALAVALSLPIPTPGSDAARNPGTEVSSPAPASAPTSSRTSSPSPSPVASADSRDSELWVIGMAKVGPVGAGMTPQHIADANGESDTEPWFVDQANSGCSFFTLGDTGSASHTSAVAVSQGGRGPIDFFVVSGTPDDEGSYPATEEGLTIGTTVSEVEVVYGSQIVETSFVNTERRLIVQDGDDAIVFDINEGLVTSISTGRFDQISGFSECA